MPDDFAKLKAALSKLHYAEGRDAALLGRDRGLCPYQYPDDKANWEDGYDSVADTGNFEYEYDQYPYYE